MVSFFALTALALLPAALAQQLTVNTPQGVVVCQPIQLSWTGGTAPYFLSFVPAGQPAATPIKQFPQQTGNSFTWEANLPGGTSFSIALKDASGSPVFSDIVNVQSGPDTSCLNTSVTESGTGGSAAATSGGSGTTPAAASTSGGSGASSTGGSSASVKPTGSTTATSSAASPTNSNAASNTRGNALAVAGVMGLVGAALF